MFDAATIRKDFPILGRQVHGKPLVWLDSAATSQKPRQVTDAMVQFAEEHNANVRRGVHQLSAEATQAYENAREAAARFVGADPQGTVFTKNATEALNLLAYSYARSKLGPGDILLTTAMEHHANLVPWQMVASEAGFEMQYVPVTAEGLLDREAFDQIVASGRVKIFAVTHMSNVLGTINPVAELAAAVRAANEGAKVFVDGAQSVPHLPTDRLGMGADAIAYSGHKLLGPTGIGVLASTPELLADMPPFLGGGEMILNVTLDGPTFNEVPYKFEAGTPPFMQAVGLHAALDYLSELGMDAVRQHEVELLNVALPALQEIDGVTIHGPLDPSVRGSAISFAVDGLHPHDISTIMDREGVAVRAGHHCAKPLVKTLGVAATTRASFYVYNTVDEVEPLVEAIHATKRFFAR